MPSGLSRFNKKPIIISAGCSFTDPDFISSLEDLPSERRGGWPIWSDRFWWKLEKFHNKKYRIIHTGHSGGSMDRAYQEIIKNISVFGKKIDYVLWGGTTWERWNDMHSSFDINPMQYFVDRKPIKIDEKVGRYPLDDWEIFGDLSISLMSSYYGTKDGKRRVMNEGLRKIWTVLKLCEQYDITLLYYQLLAPIAGSNYIKKCIQRHYNISDDSPYMDSRNPISVRCELDADYEWEMSETQKSPYFRDLLQYKKHFLGLYYLEPDSRPWNWENSSDENVIDNTKNSWHGVRDGHPNMYGHKNIANRLWRHYEANFT